MMNIIEKIVFLEKDADAFGFRWEKPEQIIEQIISECQEIQAHFNHPDQRNELQEEIGDLLHAVFSLCVFCQFDPEQTLKNTTTKFENRLSAVKILAQEAGFTNLEGVAFSKLMHFWSLAKQKVG